MFSIQVVVDVFLSVLTVVPYTLLLALFIMLLSVALGTILAMFQINKVGFFSKLVTIYISFMRGTPLLVQLYIVYYSIPEVITYMATFFNITVNPNTISPVYSVIIAFTLNRAAYQAQNIKGALQSVEYGQLEAAYSVGLTTKHAYVRIIFPQALIVAVPNFCYAYIGTIKALSLAFMVSIVDILAKAKLEAAINFRYIESYLAAALVFWVLSVILTYLVSKIEKRLNRGRRVAI